MAVTKSSFLKCRLPFAAFDLLLRAMLTGLSLSCDCCARAASGHAAAPPTRHLPSSRSMFAGPVLDNVLEVLRDAAAPRTDREFDERLRQLEELLAHITKKEASEQK